MKRTMIIGALTLAIIVIGTAWVGAQHQMGGQMPMGGQGGQQEQMGAQPSQQPMMGRGMMGQGMMGQGMMCPMMAMMMDPMGMGMMGGRQMDTKTMAQLLQLRGDMLKAMGEVMLKHGKALEEPK
jgi:hypothetical protein